MVMLRSVLKRLSCFKTEKKCLFCILLCSGKNAKYLPLIILKTLLGVKYFLPTPAYLCKLRYKWEYEYQFWKCWSVSPLPAQGTLCQDATTRTAQRTAFQKSQGKEVTGVWLQNTHNIPHFYTPMQLKTFRYTQWCDRIFSRRQNC